MWRRVMLPSAAISGSIDFARCRSKEGLPLCGFVILSISYRLIYVSSSYHQHLREIAHRATCFLPRQTFSISICSGSVATGKRLEEHKLRRRAEQGNVLVPAPRYRVTEFRATRVSRQLFGQNLHGSAHTRFRCFECH